MKNREVDRIIDEAMKNREEILTDLIENDPEIANAKAPDTFADDLFAKIREYEREQQKKLSPEEEELIRLGKIYKKRKKWNKVVILIAAVVCLLALGITTVGGPKRALEEFKRTIGGREQSYVNNDEERGMEIDSVEEEDAYEEIEEKFGVAPIRMSYIPEGMEFTDAVIEEETQNARMLFKSKKEKAIVYTMMFNYRATSIGLDVEDGEIGQKKETVKGVEVFIKQIQLDEDDSVRWKVEFLYQNVYYSITTVGISEGEIEEIIKNLYFF